ncbi:DSPc-domain-containing protein, partial [Xylona heveae TC161]
MRLSLRLDELQEEDIEEPLSHEAKKSPAYPCGPVCVYDPHVYLYLEPNEVEASQFDVVLNVAREVNNPFLLRKERRASEGTLDYIHVPWDHNTNIVDDMLSLVKVIDDRVAQGKRVLVHCQCGVSRSASLIVAYGLYKNPDLTVQQAYDAVKQRSRWIGPNMNLIYQLSEF